MLHPRPAASAAQHVALLREGLREHGYFEGKHYSIELRAAEGNYERLPSLAAELARLKVDVIVTGSTPGTRAAKQASSTIPIVMSIAGDAVSTGLVASLARPGGNVTGATFFDPELSGKRVDLLREALPRMARLAVLLNPKNPQVMGTTLQAVKAAARSNEAELLQFEVSTPEGFGAAFAAMNEQRAHALKLVDDPLFLSNLPSIAKLAQQARLPSAGAREFAQAGGMLGYGVDIDGFWRRAAYFVDKILKGAKPADIPVERATQFQLLVNARTARALGVALPPVLLVRADRVLE